jgi:plasmid replication initiation protein
MKQGRPPHQIVRFQVYDFLVSTNRSTGQKGYQLLEKALDRLRSVSIKTNIKTGDTEEIASFGLLDWWHMVVDASNATVQVKISDWLYRAITNLEVLTLHRDYFRLDGGLERRIYELCRKHCGHQEKWVVGLETMHEKSGSSSPLKLFRHYMHRLVDSNHLPDYWLSLNAKEDQLAIYPQSHKGGLRMFKDTLGMH